MYGQQISAHRWQLQTVGGKIFTVRSKTTKVYRSSWLVILSFKIIATGKNINLPIAKDALSTEQFVTLLSRTLS